MQQICPAVQDALGNTALHCAAKAGEAAAGSLQGAQEGVERDELRGLKAGLKGFRAELRECREL